MPTSRCRTPYLIGAQAIAASASPRWRRCLEPGVGQIKAEDERDPGIKVEQLLEMRRRRRTLAQARRSRDAHEHAEESLSVRLSRARHAAKQRGLRRGL